MEQTLTHVYPYFGQAHDMSVDCWCGPAPDAKRPELIVHNVIYDDWVIPVRKPDGL